MHNEQHTNMLIVTMLTNIRMFGMYNVYNLFVCVSMKTFAYEYHTTMYK